MGKPFLNVMTTLAWIAVGISAFTGDAERTQVALLLIIAMQTSWK